MNSISIKTPNEKIKGQELKQNKLDNKDKNKKSDNIDFLSILLKDIKKGNNKNKSANSSEKESETKEFKESLKELLLDNSINSENLNKIANIEVVLNRINSNKDIVKTIRKIIISELKLKNSILNKVEMNQLKKIDNVNDLINFANKKELNIKKITIQVAKNLKENPKLLNDFKEEKINNKKNSKISTLEIVSTKKEVKNKFHLLSKNNNKRVTKKETKNILQNNRKIEQKKDDSILSNLIKDSSKTKSNTIKNKGIDLNSLLTKEIKEDTPKISKKIDLNSLLNSKNNKNSEIDEKIAKHSEKNSIETDRNINPNITINEIKAKQVLAKQTINYFKNNLDEAIKNYKPPVSKVNIELNPKNLGKVEVSIIQRGNNISLHLNSDQNNLVLFQNHQVEFRQALTNIGFSNIDMNFNSNQEKERRENQAKKTYKKNEEEMSVLDIDIEAKYKYA